MTTVAAVFKILLVGHRPDTSRFSLNEKEQPPVYGGIAMKRKGKEVLIKIIIIVILIVMVVPLIGLEMLLKK